MKIRYSCNVITKKVVISWLLEEGWKYRCLYSGGSVKDNNNPIYEQGQRITKIVIRDKEFRELFCEEIPYINIKNKEHFFSLIRYK